MGASTIVVAREDLSIPGAASAGDGASAASDIEARFFNVVRQSNPDVVVLDLTSTEGQGIPAILKIRRRTSVPILVICGTDDKQMREYRLAGAAECMQAPIDIIQLNQTVQQIIQLARSSAAPLAAEPRRRQLVCFSGLMHDAHQNLLIGADQATIKLTTSENRVLMHFVSNPLALCTRDALADALYGARRPNSDRAVDVIVTRLRKKIGTLAGAAAQSLIKTEFRRGYVFVAEVTFRNPAVMQRLAPPLEARTA